jgi:hypothetical protein
LELSRVALLLDSNLGHCIQFLRRISSNEVELSYQMNFRDAQNKVFLEKLKNFKGPKNFIDLTPAGELIVPDLRKLFCRFSIANNVL